MPPWRIALRRNGAVMGDMRWRAAGVGTAAVGMSLSRVPRGVGVVMRGRLRGRFSASYLVVFAAALIATILAGAGRAQAQVDATISLTKTASPTTFSAAGQVINYTYHVTNDAGSAREVNNIP
jgi:hypothetical protein